MANSPKKKGTIKQAKKKERSPFDGTSMEALEAAIALDALKLAHKQIQNGTASSQVQTHFLKVASSAHKLEKAKLKGEIKLIDAKVDNLKEQKNTKELYENAILALKSYGSPIISNSQQESDDSES